MKRAAKKAELGRAERTAVFFVIAAAVAAAAAFPTKGKNYKPPVVLVLIGNLKKPVTLVANDLSGPGLRKNDRSAKLVAKGSSLTVNGRRTRVPAEFKAGEPIRVNGKSYRGRIRILPGSPPALVNAVDIESYVAGVINHEIDSRWPEAAVDAQAILIRSYAAKRSRERRNEPWQLDSTVKDQVYGGADGEDDLARASALRTRGLVLTFQGNLAIGHYHSCCGGRTEVPSEVWGGADLAYQRSVACPFCQEAPRYFWRFPEVGAIPGDRLAALLGLKGRINDLEIVGRNFSHRVTRIKIKAGRAEKTLSGVEFRKRIGYTRVFSTAFEVEKAGDGFIIRGSGSGHGVGMCQWGARGMALQGFSAGAILGYYFPGTSVKIMSELD